MEHEKTLFLLIILYLITFMPTIILATGYDGYESDNYFTQANLIWNGSPEQHTIYPVGDEDWVKFTIPRDCNVFIETFGTVGDTRMWLYDGTNPTVTTIYQNNFNTSPGWYMEGQWAFGQPLGGGGGYGSPDPISGNTGSNVYGYNLNGNYPDNLNPTQYLTTTAINCSGYGMVKLRFWRWLGVERYTYDEAHIEVSNDGIYWYTVWQNPDTEVADSGWTLQEYDISSIADNKSTVYIRWGMGPTDDSVTYCGWNIDDVEITGISLTSGLTLLEYDDDSGEGYFSYIDRVCGVDPLPAGTYYVQIDEYGDDNEIAEYFLNVTITPCAQKTIYVDDDAINDPAPYNPDISDPLEDGTVSHPYDAIQEAINVSVDGDMVLVKDGTYSGTGNYNINFSWDFGYGYHRSIEVKSENGAESTIIDCTGRDVGFNLNHKEGIFSIIEGFSIHNADFAGIYLYNSSPFIKSCIVAENAHVGISSYSGAPWVFKCNIMNNGSLGAGFGAGGIYCASSDAFIEDCIVSNNAGSSFSGGIIFEDCYGNPGVLNTLIYGNICNSDGGGVATMWSYPTLINCVIMGNYSANEGGGIYLMVTSNPNFINCTITKNEAGGNGGGMYSTGNSNPVFKNTILWENYPNEIQLHPTEPGNPVVSYSDIRGGWSGSGTNNINADPKFIDFGLLPSEIPQIYYRLASGSPCIDAGTSDLSYAFDIDYQQRIDDPVASNTGGGPYPYYDIGAYEFRARYVNGTTGNDSWNGLLPVWNGVSGPKKTIQALLNIAYTGEQVIVASGIYTGTGNRDLNFDGKDLHLISEKGASQTIIDCQASSSNEHRGILFYNGETPKAFVKGFTIKNGCYATSGNGGAIAFDGSDAGIFDCLLLNNSAHNGGAIDCVYSSPTIANCVIKNNSALGDWAQGNGNGGGLNLSYWIPYIKNCLIVDNYAQTHGGGIYCMGSPKILNSTIYSNSAPLGGEAMYVWQYPVIKDCIIWDNRIYASPTEDPIVTYSDVESASGEWWFGEGCISLNPYLVYGSPYNACLSQIAAGQIVNSPCVDAGSAPVEDVGMSNYSTRTDGVLDSGQVNMGYHARYALRIYSMVRGSGNVTIYWNGISRVSYVVEWSTDMLSWNSISVGEVSQWSDTNIAGYTKKFYRVREE